MIDFSKVSIKDCIFNFSFFRNISFCQLYFVGYDLPIVSFKFRYHPYKKSISVVSSFSDRRLSCRFVNRVITRFMNVLHSHYSF